MLSLPRQGFPVTCRIGHCCVCSPLALLFCLRHTLRFANSKQRMNKISPKPCHKKCRSANLLVCKSASLQVCRSAGLQVCRSASLQSAFVAHRLIFYRRTVTVTCCQSMLKSIPNFLLFFQHLFDLLGDLIFRSASNFVEKRIWSTICDSLFWVIYEFVTRWRLKN